MRLRAILGLLYLAMGVGQLVSWHEMPGILGGYDMVPRPLLPWLAGVLIAAEFGGGVWLLVRAHRTRTGPVWLYTGVALVWTVLGVQAYLRGVPVANCGCFGSYLGQRLSWFTLAQDVLLLVYAGLMWRSARRSGAGAGGEAERVEAPVEHSAPAEPSVPPVEPSVPPLAPPARAGGVH